jgi:hypothetical protein
VVDVSPSMHGDLPALSSLLTDYFNHVVRTQAPPGADCAVCVARAGDVARGARHAALDTALGPPCAMVVPIAVKRLPPSLRLTPCLFPCPPGVV